MTHSYTFQHLTFCSSIISLLSGLDFSFTVITLCSSVLLFLPIHFPAHFSLEPQCSPSLTLSSPLLTPAAVLVSLTTVLASSSPSHTTPSLKCTFTCRQSHTPTSPPPERSSASGKQAEFYTFHTHLLFIAHLHIKYLIDLQVRGHHKII